MAGGYNRDPKGYEHDTTNIAVAIGQAALKHTHEKSWAFVKLPTVLGQGYGRILLQQFYTSDPRSPGITTQATFVDRTLPHSHFVNRAWSAGPRGQTLINRQLEPVSREKARQTREIAGRRVSYSSTDDRVEVVEVPSGTIHIIEADRKFEDFPLLEEIAEMDPQARRRMIGYHRYGERSAFHVYMMDPRMMAAIEEAGLLRDFPDITKLNDMTLWDSGGPFLAGGGAWPQRIATFEKTGEHCNVCTVEADDRRIYLPAERVYDLLLTHPVPEAKNFTVGNEGLIQN